MDFQRLVKFIRQDGCPVRLYQKTLLKMNQSVGTFDITKKGNPIICIAVQGHTQLELRRLLLHEYAHFLQLRDSFVLICEDIIKGWDILDKWLKGKEYSEEELQAARNCILVIEYDAEIRTIQIARVLDTDIGDVEEYIKNAYSYITSIKNTFKTRIWTEYTELNLCNRKLLPEEILAELTDEELLCLA